MRPETIGIVIGGLFPALLYAGSGLFSKASVQAGIGLGVYLIIAGLTIAVVGIVFCFFIPDKTISIRSGMHAAGLGATWGVGTGMVAMGLAKYHVPLGKLVPLYNMNTLIAVLLALWIFAEWKQVKVPQLLFGSLLIVVGGTLVARA